MGCASIASRSVIPAILSLSEEYELVAIASRTLLKAQRMAEQFGCEALEGYENLILRPDIDAIYMPLPTGLHREWILKSLLAGKHVYAEKTLAMSFNDAKDMVQLAREKHCALMEGYMFQYHIQHQKVFKLISKGLIGEIRHFSSSFGFPPLALDNFRYDESIGGGALMDCAGYTVRAAHFILREPLMVLGAVVNYDSVSKTSLWGSALLKGKNNIGASLSFGFDNFYQCNYVLWGSKGKLTMTKAFTPKIDECPLMILERQGVKEEFVLPADNHFKKAFLHFYQDIISCDFEDDYNSILEQSWILDKISSSSK